MRELVWMAEEKERTDWMKTASLMAQQYNLHRDSNRRAATAADFYPFRETRNREYMSETEAQVFFRAICSSDNQRK